MKYAICLVFLSVSTITNLFAQNINQLSKFQLDSVVATYYMEGRYEEALPYSHKAVEKAKLVGIDSSYAYALNDLATLYADMRDYKKSEELYMESKNIRKKVLGEEHEDYAYSLNNLGILYMDMLQYEKAELFLLESQKIRKKILGEEHPDYAYSLSNLAILYLAIANYDAAEPFVLEAQKIRKKILGEEHPDYATALHNVAELYADMGKYELAEQFYLQAGEIWKKSLGENHKFYTTYLVNLAYLYSKTNQYEAAEKLYLQNIAIGEKLFGKNHPEYAIALNNLANLYVKMKKNEVTEKLFVQALGIIKKVHGEQHPTYATTLGNLASVYSDMKKYKESELLLLQGKEIEKKILGEKHPNYMRSLTNLATLCMHTKRYEEALNYAFYSIQANCKNSPPDTNQLAENIAVLVENEFYSDTRLVIALDCIYRISEAQYKDFGDKKYLEYGYATLHTAMQINEKIRNSLNAEEDKLRTLREMGGLVKSAIATGLRLSENDQKYTENAFKYAEQNKSVLLADALKGQRAHALSDLPDSLALYEIDLQGKKKKLERAVILAKDDNEISTVRTQQTALNLEIEAFKKQLERSHPKYYQLKYLNITASAKDVQKKLDAKSLFLEYFIADSVVYLFFLTQKDLKLISLKMQPAKLKEKVANLRKALSDYLFIKNEASESYQLYTQTASWFYQELLAPALKDAKGIEQLIIVSDGELGHLPFETFLVKEAPQGQTDYTKLDYLGMNYSISYHYSATLFATPPQLDKKRKNNGQFLAFAADYAPSKDSSSISSTRAPHVQNMRKTLNELPAAKEEVKVLSELFEGVFLQNKEANESQFKANAEQFSIIHLAMHGILHERSPILSSLAFTENDDSTEDNFLEAWEISRLNLNADLVVLSACETGYGKFEQGEGVISLARAFMYAGTSAVVVSLWQVNDYSTAAIMQFFYENLATGMTKSKALQQAKSKYLQQADGIAAHPAFWSPFILIGDESPIFISPKGGYLWWGMAGLGVLVLSGGVLALRRKKE